MKLKIVPLFFSLFMLMNYGLMGAPVVTGFSVFSGPSSGGTQVEVTGSGFTGVTEVQFGDTTASFSFNSDTSLTAYSPIHSPEVVFVTVTTPEGTSPPTENAYFVYLGHWQIYVENLTGLNVTVIDATTDNVTAIPPTGELGNPVSIGMTPDGAKALITNQSPTNNVAVIDTVRNQVTFIPIEPPSSPSAVAVTPDGTKAFVANFSGNDVSVINVANGSVTTIDTAGANPVAVAITPNSTKAYVSNPRTGVVTDILTVDNSFTTIPSLFAATAIAITPDGTKAYVTLAFENDVAVINTDDDSVTKIPVGFFPISLAITPDGKQVYTTNLEGNVSVIYTADNSVMTVPSIGLTPIAVAITPDGQKAYVCNYDSGDVAVINTTDLTFTTIPSVGTNPTTLVITPDGEKVYVANQGDNAVAIIETATDTVVNYLPTGGAPSSMNITPDQAPLARFIATLAPSKSASFFDAFSSISPVGTIANYSWDFGDGTTLETSSPTVSHTYLLPGSYSVTLTVTNSAGTSTSQIFNSASLPVVDPFLLPGSLAFISYNYYSFTNNGGPSATTRQTLTIVSPLPIITGVHPNSSQVCGGISVEITGVNFTGATQVLFGSTPATRFVVNSDQLITGVVPPGKLGTVDVRVITPAGESSVTPADAFTYLPPLPPREAKVRQVKNRFATQTDLINLLSWKAPCGNCPPVAYRIYRDRALTQLVAKIPVHDNFRLKNHSRHRVLAKFGHDLCQAGPSFRFEDHHRKKGKTYHYFIVSVDQEGNLSVPVEVTIKGTRR